MQDPKDLGNIHTPDIDEYTYFFKGNQDFPSFNWWFCALMSGSDGRKYMSIITFHPKMDTMYRFGKETKSIENSFPANKEVDFVNWSKEELGYKKFNDKVILWCPKEKDYNNLSGTYSICILKKGKHHLRVNTYKTCLDLNFTSLGIPFWYNKGREATLMKRSSPLIGVEEILEVKGYVEFNDKKIFLEGFGVHEHLFFKILNFGWKREDWIVFNFEELYGILIQLDFNYMDGGIYLKDKNKYLIPINLKINHIRFDKKNRVPLEIHIAAKTIEGDLDVTGESIGLLCSDWSQDKQIGINAKGTFTFNDGRVLKLTKGLAWDAVTVRTSLDLLRSRINLF
jgi:hypothetical protein